jgi:aspartate/methionine/tyrosine aminotransferase
MRIETFRMERMQSRYGNEVEYNLSESGVEPMTLQEVLALTPDPDRILTQPLGYPQANGTETLRERIATFYPSATAENVTVVNGGGEANFITLWTLLDTKGRLAFMLPNYMQGWGLGRHFSAGTDAFRLKLDRKRNRWALDTDELDRAVTKDTTVILVTNPNNPTGAVLSGEEMDAIVTAAKKSKAWLVVDEIYRGAELDGHTTQTFWGRYDKTVITSGLSKAFGLPGLRIGWMVAPPKLIEQLWIHHDYTTLTPGMLSERLATIATEPANREKILQRTRELLNRNLPILEDWIEEQGDLLKDYVRPQAGAIAYFGYRAPIRSSALVDRLRTDHSVLLVPGEHFGMGRYLRVGYGSDPDYTLKGLARLQELLKPRVAMSSPSHGSDAEPRCH